MTISSSSTSDSDSDRGRTKIMAKSKLQEVIELAHDQVIESDPDYEHDEAACEICIAKAEDPQGGQTVSQTYTKEQLDAEVAQATDALAARVAELEAVQNDADVAGKIAAAKAEVQAQLEEVQAQLDTAKIELQAAEDRATAAEQNVADVTAYLEGEKQAVEEAAALEARKEERISKVKEVASFEDEYLTANADRWASMSDELFTATLDDYKAVAEKASKGKGKAEEPVIPAATGLQSASSESGEQSALAFMGELQAAGYDPRRVIQTN